MRVIALLGLLILVGALQQQLVVDISFNPQGQPFIEGYERAQGEDPTRDFGPWTLQLRDSELVVSQTKFDPYVIEGTGARSYVEQVSVPILAPASARSIEVLDEQGERVDAYPIGTYCGDNLCEDSELNSCSLDCAPQAVDAYNTQISQQPLAVDEGRGFGYWATIGSIGLLILILIAVLIHLNRKKPQPLQMQY